MVRLGVIGYGYWGPNLVRNFSEFADAAVVMVCDRSAERLKAFHTRYRDTAVTTDPGEMIRADNVDAVVVATPVSTHFELAAQALEGGKHVLVEKPITTSQREAAILIEKAAKRRLTLMVDHTFVYTGAVRKIKEIVEEGRLGQLYYFDSVRTNLGLFQHDVNVLWDLAVHDLSIMDRVVGDSVRAVSATGAAHLKEVPEDVAYLTCFLDNNVIAHIHVNWLSPVKIRRTIIGGDRQMILYDDSEPSEKIRVYDKGITLNEGPEGTYQKKVGYRTGDCWLPQVDATEALKTEARHFLDCVQNGSTPLTDGAAGMRVVRVLEAATESLASRGRLVEINPT